MQKVLLIEQDPKQIEIYSERLKEVTPFEIDVVSRTEGALQFVEKFSYPLVIIDSSVISENQTNGLEFLERVKRVSPHTSVVYITDRASVEEAVAAIRLGAEDYLEKPFKVERFQLAVKRGLDKKVVYDSMKSGQRYLNLIHSCQMISSSLEQRKIFSNIENFFQRELQPTYTAVFHLKKDRSLHRIQEAQSEKEENGMSEILEISLESSNALAMFHNEHEFYRFQERGPLSPSIFLFRFECGDGKEFLCVCLSPKKPDSLELFESHLKILKTQIEMTGRNIDQYQGVRHLIYRDEVTGLYNTRYLNEVLEREIKTAEESSSQFSVLFLDCDDFKKINDNHGHLVGSKILNEIGLLMRKFVRNTDSMFRYGGDEFVTILSPANLDTAKRVAERIREGVEKKKFLAREGLNIRITVSIGVAVYPDHAASKKEIIEAADHAMYQAKRKTKNSVFLAEIA